jgi:hypothetical protein
MDDVGWEMEKKKHRLIKPAMLFLFHSMDYGLWTMDYGLWTMDYGLWIMDTKLPSPNSALSLFNPSFSRYRFFLSKGWEGHWAFCRSLISQ